MSEYRITLPWPPTNNNLFTVARGRKIKSQKGRNYLSEVAAYVLINRLALKLSSNLSVTITAYPPTRAKRDLDNLFKAPLDALTQCGVIADDSLIDDLRIVRWEVVKGGRLDITITEQEVAA